jgi:colanic acid biosynthesis glycosyl transferase WcaI
VKIDPIFVSQVFHPDRQATSVLLSQLASQLAERGFQPVVYAGYPAADPGAKTPASELWQGVNIRRGGLRIDGKKNLAARGLAYLAYSAWLKWTLLLRTPAKSHLIVLTNPPFAPVLVWLCGWWRGWTYEVFLHDVYPDGLVALGQLSPRGLLTLLWTAANRRAFTRARRVLVLGRDMAELCRDRYGVEPGKILVVPSWSPVDFPARPPAEETRLWHRLGFHDQFVVQYSGNMGLWHDLQSIVEAAGILREEPGVHFLMIGDGRRRVEAEQLAGRLALRNITWLPFQPPAELGDSLACCHAAIVSQRAGLEGVAVPSKLYGILASGRAVLAQVPVTSETARVVRERECGLVIHPGDAAALVAAIRRMRDDPAATGRMGSKAAEAGATQYTLASAVDLFESVILKIPGPAGNPLRGAP